MESDVLKAVEEISGYTPEEMIAMYDDYGRLAKECEAYAGKRKCGADKKNLFRYR